MNEMRDLIHKQILSYNIVLSFTDCWLCCVVDPGHGPGEAQRGLPPAPGPQQGGGPRVSVPQSYLSHVGSPFRWVRATVPPTHWQEGRQHLHEVGSKFYSSCSLK